MGDILLNDILRIKEEDLDKVAIRFNLSNKSYDALKLYQDNKDVLLVNNFHNVLKTEKDGKVKRGRKYLKKGEIVIGLAEMKNNSWLLFEYEYKTSSTYEAIYDYRRPSDPTDTNVYIYSDHCGWIVLTEKEYNDMLASPDWKAILWNYFQTKEKLVF